MAHSRSMAVLCVACCVLAVTRAENPSAAAAPEALKQAAAALRAGDFRGALVVLDAAGAALRSDWHAWYLRGTAHLRSQDPKSAQVDFLRARQIDARDPRPLFYLGVAAAQLGKTDEAFDWFAKAQATKRFDMTSLDGEPDLQALRDDPRYAQLMPQPSDFAHPFVENVTIIREWNGEASGDQFGWIARVIGDVDRDGANDFVTSAPSKDIQGANAGKIYVYSGRTGAMIWSVAGTPNDELGSGIEAAGDTDGDGIADVIGSAPGNDRAFVYCGADGRLLQSWQGEAHGDRFGEHVASVGDVDGDGRADVIVGAPANNLRAKKAGRAYVYSGKSGRVLAAWSGERAGDAYGSTVGGYSNGHQHFLIVGAPGAGARHRGRVYVYRDLSGRPAFTIDADASGVALGYMFVSVPGDVDGDGIPDVFASDWSDNERGIGAGKIYVVSGRTGQRLWTLTGQTAGEGFGTTHSVAGDVDGDGRADLIVGSWQYSAVAQSAGRAYLYDGASGKLLRTYTSRIPGDTFGFDAVGMGAVAANGEAELLITAAWSGVNGFHSGRIFLLSSGLPAQRKQSAR